MQIEFRHEIEGTFGFHYVEETAPDCSEETVAKAFKEFRKDYFSALWAHAYGVTDIDTVASICMTWDTMKDHEDKVVTIHRNYGMGNRTDSVIMTWAKAKNYFKQFVNNA